MAFYQNTELTFQVLSEKNILNNFFNQWNVLLQAGKIKHDFELRKILVGLGAILRANPA